MAWLGLALPGMAFLGLALPGTLRDVDASGWPFLAWPCLGWPPGLAWRGLALHGVALPGVALLGMASPGVALPVIVLCWCPFLVEHRRWIIHLMEFQLEFLLDHMLVVSFWYVLLVEPSHAICMKARYIIISSSSKKKCKSVLIQMSTKTSKIVFDLILVVEIIEGITINNN